MSPRQERILISAFGGTLALLVLVLSVLATIAASQLYMNDYSENCPSGMAAFGEAIPIGYKDIVALLATLVALPIAFYKAIIRRRRAWVIILVVATALGVLLIVTAATQVSAPVVIAILGPGCARDYGIVPPSVAFFVVGVPVLVSLVIDLVTDMRRGH